MANLPKVKLRKKVLGGGGGVDPSTPMLYGLGSPVTNGVEPTVPSGQYQLYIDLSVLDGGSNMNIANSPMLWVYDPTVPGWVPFEDITYTFEYLETLDIVDEFSTQRTKFFIEVVDILEQITLDISKGLIDLVDIEDNTALNMSHSFSEVLSIYDAFGFAIPKEYTELANITDLFLIIRAVLIYEELTVSDVISTVRSTLLSENINITDNKLLTLTLEIQDGADVNDVLTLTVISLVSKYINGFAINETTIN